MKRVSDCAVALDVGTTKICVLVGRLDGASVELIGVGITPSAGIAKGVVVDVGRAVDSIKDAIRQAELMSGVTIEQVHVGISGGHIQSFSSQGMVAIKHGEIRQSDVQQALEAAKARILPEGQQLLHFIPQYFVLDGAEQVLDPRGMYAMRLEVYAHGITGSVASVHNLVRCVERAGVGVSDIVLEQLASAQAVLTNDERFLGVAMIDIGGGTSDVAFYKNGALVGTHVLPVAGTLFTSDLAVGLRTSLLEAERIKKLIGLAPETCTNQIEYLLSDGATKELVDKEHVAFILQARATELFSLLHTQLGAYFAPEKIPAGIVLTGGGSLLQGISKIARAKCRVPVRIGNPHVPAAFETILGTPIHATGYGLLLHALKNQDTNVLQRDTSPLLFRVFARMKSWISDFV